LFGQSWLNYAMRSIEYFWFSLFREKRTEVALIEFTLK